MAPIYDSGSSLGYDKSIPLMMDENETICKPFKKRHEDQLRLVTSFDWIDFSALEDIRERITEILSDANAADYLDARRIRVIAELTKKRVRQVKNLARSGNHGQADSADGDVKENVAADYLPKTEK